MRIPSGVTDQFIYFVAVDSTDFTTRETGLSSFTVYRSRNGGAASAMTTPTINETDATNMPGVYELLLDEDMTIDAGDDSQEMVFHITHAGMSPVTLVIELYRRTATAGNTLDVTAGGTAGIDWGNVENPSTTLDLSATTISLCDTVTTNTDMRGTDGANTTTPPTVTAIRTEIDSNSTQLASIVADSNELQTDWADGGRLDLILDARASQSSVDALDVYHAEIRLTIDEANTRDEYTVTWFKNGVALSSGITSPTIQVKTASGAGADLIASTSISEVGSTGIYAHNESSNRTTAGDAVQVIVTATIDSSTRTFKKIAYRDSTS